MKVIIVKDDGTFRRLFSDMILHQWPDAEISKFSDGDEALSNLAHEAYDLLITDQMHPGLKGIDLVKAARLTKVNRNLKAVVISGYLASEPSTFIKSSVELTKKTGWLPKPFSATTLIRTIEILIRKKTK